MFSSLFELHLNQDRTLLIVAFYLQKNVHWRFELGDYRSYVTLALTLLGKCPTLNIIHPF